MTSAGQPIPQEWIGLPRLEIVVSIDGLQPEHDVRRAPATTLGLRVGGVEVGGSQLA